MRAAFGDDYYICRFQEPGKMEAEMAEVGTEYVLKNILTTRKTGPPIFPKGEYGAGFNPDTPDTLPSWLTEDGLAYCVSKFEKTGFTGGLNYYRNFNLFQEPGKMEAEMAEVGTAYVLKNILTTRQTGPPIFPKGEYGTGFNPDTPDTLPSWLTEDDLAYYVSKFEKTGFTGGLNYYRNFNLNWELTAPWSGFKIQVPVKFITVRNNELE
ncbi:unnamed protein product [Vicia faba]|uniref:Uncharacterized protein n=1 Tax=Vicia faba TaxID=3906 RepID=A0AAV1AXZ3_VICFA|nr:unnamed protein product [Vicia faba]